MVTRQATVPAVAATEPTIQPATEPTAAAIAPADKPATEKTIKQATMPSATAIALAEQMRSGIAAIQEATKHAIEQPLTHRTATILEPAFFETARQTLIIDMRRAIEFAAQLPHVEAEMSIQCVEAQMDIQREILRMADQTSHAFSMYESMYHERHSVDSAPRMTAKLTQHGLETSANDIVVTTVESATVESATVESATVDRAPTSLVPVQPEPRRCAKAASEHHATATPCVATVLGRPPGVDVKEERPPGVDYEQLAELGCCAGGAILMMQPTPTSTTSTVETPEMLQAMEAFNDLNLPSADLMLLKPDLITWDEFVQYVARLDEDELDYLLENEMDEESAECPYDEAFGVAIILKGAEADDVTTENVFSCLPQDTLPFNFARALVLLGDDTRAALLAWGRRNV